jgi:branched-chain amino acid transport system substrate-binding protein
MGPSLALFDVGVAALKASGNPKDKTAVANAMKTMKVSTPVGHLDWTKGPVPNVVQTPIPGGQWVKGSGKFPYEWVFCEHTDDHNIPIQAKLKPYNS